MTKRTYYTHPQEEWDEAECRKRANHIAKDGMGTPYPFKGYIGSNQPNGGRWGMTTYNGGCEHDGEWYDGEIRRLPIVAAGYAIVNVPSLGFRIYKLEGGNAVKGESGCSRTDAG